MEVSIRPEELATFLAAKVLEKKAQDVVILDMRGLASYTDTFVICSASNRRQVKAIANHLREAGKKALGHPPIGVEGVEAARWVLVDFGDAVVHLWGDAPRLPVPEVQVLEEEDEDSESHFTL
jgi:ribosome-associated protein